MVETKKLMTESELPKSFKDYSQLKQEESVLKEKLSDLKGLCLMYMEKNKMSKIESNRGLFYESVVPIYQFSKSIQNLEITLKANKKSEIELGIAKVKSKTIKFNYKG